MEGQPSRRGVLRKAKGLPVRGCRARVSEIGEGLVELVGQGRRVGRREYNLVAMVKVKVCGITNVGDALAATEFGADALGFVFAESSRRVGVREAREVAETVPEGVLKVGVFVNEQPGEVLRIAEAVGLGYAQLHGDEGPETVTELRDRGVKVIKALRVRDEGSLAALERFEADLFLLDAYSEKARGGTGEKFDWGLAKSLEGRDNILVSGGLGPENVGEAIRLFRPYGVDASSSLESAPGKKDRERVRRFIFAARN